MTTHQISLSKPTRTGIIVHANITGCNVKHKTYGALLKCEAKHGIDY